MQRGVGENVVALEIESIIASTSHYIFDLRDGKYMYEMTVNNALLFVYQAKWSVPPALSPDPSWSFSTSKGLQMHSTSEATICRRGQIRYIA